mmetsp:Transcript_41765/g.67159  ORF Transcript_41765/g.67159 Transcript_41765/m.67159 type:complete len:112 (-) Transcript_41765:1563-1898(-)
MEHKQSSTYPHKYREITSFGKRECKHRKKKQKQTMRRGRQKQIGLFGYTARETEQTNHAYRGSKETKDSMLLLVIFLSPHYVRPAQERERESNDEKEFTHHLVKHFNHKIK